MEIPKVLQRTAPRHDDDDDADDVHDHDHDHDHDRDHDPEPDHDNEGAATTTAATTATTSSRPQSAILVEDSRFRLNGFCDARALEELRALDELQRSTARAA